ncbi:MAG: MFS transporter [Candidatus Heimdallarchaeota archaeon]|nr:MAG: MFS transporter [Candidatus Heimdallarchaeota archaeon]
MTENSVSVSLGYLSDKQPVSENKKSLIYSIAIGKEVGNFTGAAYAQIYAVFIQSTPFVLAIITSMRNLIQLAVQSPFGRLSDKFGRKPFLVSGLFVSALMSFLYPLITDPLIFLGAMIIYSLAFSIFTPSWIAVLGDSSKESMRGSFIGRITTVSVIFTMVVFLITGWVVPLISADYAQQYSIIFRIGAFGFFLAGIITLFMKETAPITVTNHLSPKGVKNSLVNTFKPLKENPTFRRFVLVSALMDFSMSTGWPIFIFVRERYASPTEYSLMWAAFMVCQVISLVIGGYLIDKHGKVIGFWGRRVMFLIPIVLFFARNWIELTIGNLIGGIGFGLYFVTTNAYIIDSAPEESKGNYVGMYQLIMGVVTFVGSISMGIATELLIGFIGKWSAIYTMLVVVAILRFIGGVAFFFVEEPKKA